jgi:hypothetical protein
MYFLYPIAYPVSLILDYVFGDEPDSPKLSRSELEALMTLQTKLLNSTTSIESPRPPVIFSPNSEKNKFSSDSEKLYNTFHSEKTDYVDDENITNDEVISNE